MRDAIIIFIAIILAMMIGSYLFFNGGPSFAPATLPGTQQGRDFFSVLAEGQASGAIDRRTNYRIMTEEELTELWELVYGAGTAVPYVDFGRDEVIAVFDGTHSSGGYRVAVTDVFDKDGMRTIHIRREVPGDDCITTEAITSPFQIIRVAKTTLPISKEEEMVTTTCQ